jgi:hypothetical protein
MLNECFALKSIVEKLHDSRMLFSALAVILNEREKTELRERTPPLRMELNSYCDAAPIME